MKFRVEQKLCVEKSRLIEEVLLTSVIPRMEQMRLVANNVASGAVTVASKVAFFQVEARNYLTTFKLTPRRNCTNFPLRLRSKLCFEFDAKSTKASPKILTFCERGSMGQHESWLELNPLMGKMDGPSMCSLLKQPLSKWPNELENIWVNNCSINVSVCL